MIAIASDHAALEMKKVITELLEERGAGLPRLWHIHGGQL